MKKITFVVVFLFLINKLNCQINFNFLSHLIKNNCDNEMKYYLSKFYNNIEPSDTLNYLLCKYYFLKQNDDAFFYHVEKCKNIVVSDTNFLNYVSIQYLTRFDHATKRWFSYNLQSPSKCYNLFKNVYNNNIPSDSFLDEQSLKSYKQWQKSLRKNPVFAGVLSAILPGLGKVYIGKSYSGMLFFISNGLCFLNTYESVTVKGFYHPVSVFNILISSVMYIVNIYGSIKETKITSYQKHKQFIYDMAKQYSNMCDINTIQN